LEWRKIYCHPTCWVGRGVKTAKHWKLEWRKTCCHAFQGVDGNRILSRL